MNVKDFIHAQLIQLLGEASQPPAWRMARLGHEPTQRKRFALRGTGYTRASHEQSKARRLMAKRSRRINRNHR